MTTEPSVVEKTFELDSKEYSLDLGQSLNRARKERRLCDFLIKVGSKEIYVHKNVASEMFGDKLKETEAGIAEIKDVDPECMEICIEYIYTGKAVAKSSKINELIRTADRMGLRKLCEGIARFLESNLDVGTFFETLQTAFYYNLQSLAESCSRYAKVNFTSIAAEEGFKSLEEGFITELIRSEETKASEVEKCKSLLSWAKFDREKRRATFEDIFQSIEVEKLPKDYKQHLFEKEPLVSESSTLLRKFCINFNTKSDSIENLEKKTEAIAIFDRTAETIQAFKPEDKSWHVIDHMPDELIGKEFSAVVIDETIFALTYGKKCYKLDLSTPKACWTELPERSKDSHVQAVALRGEVYAFHDNSSNSKAIEKLDENNACWIRIEKPSPCRSEAIVAVGDYIYTFGGFDITQLQRSVKFDPLTDSWLTLPEMPTPRRRASAAAFDDKIYVLGGKTGRVSVLRTVECFELKGKNWTTVKAMNFGHGYFNACSFGGKVYAVAGEKSDKIEEYDPSTDTWETVTSTSGKNLVLRATVTLKV